MKEVLSGVRYFEKEIRPSYRELFGRLAKGQQPLALWLGCSDSRIDPHLITQSKPGTLFVARNPGNIVPPHSQGSGMGAAIEYAVAVLGVEHIIVCGHTGCGAMQAVLDPASAEGLPQVQELIGHAWCPAQGDSEPALDEAVARNTLLQLTRVSQFPVVAERLTSGQITLHAWIYDLANGHIQAHDGNGFVDLSKLHPEPAASSHQAPRPSSSEAR